MGVLIKYPKVAARIDVAKLKKQSEILVAAAGCKGWDLGVLLTGDNNIQTLNRKYRKMDEPTDILAFPFHDNVVAGQIPAASSPDEENLGELVISVPYVQRWCRLRQTKLHNRLVRLVAHGICHCLGHDHEEAAEARAMLAQERFILGRLEDYEAFVATKQTRKGRIANRGLAPHVAAHMRLHGVGQGHED